MRIDALRHGDDAELAGLAAKIDREEVYHRMHAEMWAARLRDEPRFRAAVEDAVAVRARRASRPSSAPSSRGASGSTWSRHTSAASTPTSSKSCGTR